MNIQNVIDAADILIQTASYVKKTIIEIGDKLTGQEKLNIFTELGLCIDDVESILAEMQNKTI